MKITEIRTRVVEWQVNIVPPQPHFCTNPVDLLNLRHGIPRHENALRMGPIDGAAGMQRNVELPRTIR